MATINNLSEIDELAAGDNFVIYDVSNGDARRISLTTLMSYINSNVSVSSSDFTTQYAAPSATGFSVQVADGSNNIWLILTPTGAFATGTIVLPAKTSAADKQEILIVCTQDVTTLTVDGNGATAVTGEPASITANDSFKLKYDAATSTWYKVA